ncbi:ABC transporter permease [Clostridium subterminale]|uniref:ABC transporter permease n=1 Tax=Clostridium subterminale TaxID=1550 RepID=A0ABN1KVF0_CLOSU
MRLIRLVLINMRRQLKSPFMLLMTLIFPVVMILVINGGGLSNGSESIGIIDKSNSNHSTEVIERLSEEYSISTLEGQIEDNFNLLRENKLGAIYVIDDNFQDLLDNGELPKIKCYRTEDASGSIMAEDIITNYVSGVVEEEVSEGLSTNSTIAVIVDEEVDSKDDYRMTVLMICYFMMMGGSVIAGEIIKLREQKVLKRTIATSNSDVTILGSLFISSFIIQGVLSCLAFIILTILLKLPNNNISQGILIIFLGSLVTTSIIVVVTRWIKNVSLASLSTVVFGLVTFGLGIFGSELDSFENIPEIITRISVISPFTWLLKIIDTGKIIIPILIISLMSIMFFTAGSFRLREFVKE